MPIVRQDVPDLNDAFAEDEKLRQMVLQLDLPEVQSEGITPEEAHRRAEEARRTLEAMYGQESAPPWLNDYFMLRNEKGFPFRQAAYIAWASTPSDMRTPRTQQELAVSLGLTSDRAFSTWRRQNPAIIETIAVMQTAPLWDYRADSFSNLIKGMQKSGSDYKFFNYLKLYMETMGDYVPTSEFVANLKKKINTDASDYSDDELAFMARAYEDYQRKGKDEDNEEVEA